METKAIFANRFTNKVITNIKISGNETATKKDGDDDKNIDYQNNNNNKNNNNNNNTIIIIKATRTTNTMLARLFRKRWRGQAANNLRVASRARARARA